MRNPTKVDEFSSLSLPHSTRLIHGTPASNGNPLHADSGDLTNLQHWLKGRRDFDLRIVYYGGRNYTHEAYRRFSNVIAQYDAVMVMDDDILIDAGSLTRLFEIRREQNLWVLQPEFREVSCVNPYDRTKNRIKQTHGPTEQGRAHIEYGRVNNSLFGTLKALFQYIPDWAIFEARSVARSLLR